VAVSKNIQKSRIKIDYPKVKPYFVQPHLLDVGLTDDEIDGVKILFMTGGALSATSCAVWGE
jgi:hypothetical protein